MNTGRLAAARILVVAKAPVPGRVKTRLAASVGPLAAARVAAACLLDTIRAAEAAVGADRCVLALDGALPDGEQAGPLAVATERWTVVPQRGADLAHRLAAAHEAAGPGPVVQVGMDTPQVTPGLLREVALGLDSSDAVLGPAVDGGWWVLALRDPAHAEALRDVAMSAPDTGTVTRAALVGRGLDVGTAPELHDVDTWADAVRVAAAAPDSAFAAAWASAAVAEAGR